MASVRYRQAEESDITAMARIRAAEWGTEEYWQARISGYMNDSVHPREALKARVIYVAVMDGSVVGFIAGHLTHRHGCDGELEWIGVASEHRRTGVASKLLERLAKWFGERKASRICVDVAPDNSGARAFYKRHGAVDLKKHWLIWEDISGALVEASFSLQDRRSKT